MSRFKVSGNLYVSQWGGSDANAGTDPTLPKASIAGTSAVAGATLVIGAGVYKENTFGSATRVVIGDGKVIINGLSAGIGLGTGSSWKNIWFKNVTALGHGNAVDGNNNNIYENVIGFNSPGANPGIYRSIVLENATPLTSPGNFTLINCLIFNSLTVQVATGTTTLQACYVSKNAIIPVSNTSTFPVNSFDNNCINGKVSRNGIVYELKLNWDGSARADADPGVLDLIDVFPAVYTRGNFACVDPQFLDVYSKTVLPTSVLLKRAQNGFYIGAVVPAKIIRLDEPTFQFTYTNINTTNPLAVSTSAGQPFGQVRMTGKVSDTPVSFSVFSLRTILAFWKGAAGGTAENNNVPDAVRLLGLPAGSIDKPRRLTYQMRTSLSTTANQASADSVWDNDGAGIAGVYLIHEDGTVPQHAPSGGVTYGNGDPRAIGAPLSSFNFCSIDIIVTLDQERV